MENALSLPRLGLALFLTTLLVPACSGNGSAQGGDHPKGQNESPATCPPTYKVVKAGACDGVDWLDPALVTEQSDGIESVDGPGGKKAFRLDNGQSISLGKSDCLRLGQDQKPFSVSTWFRIADSSVPISAQIFGTDATQWSKKGLAMFLSDAETLNVGMNGIGVKNTNVLAGEWNHVAFVYTGRSARLYVNGKLANWEFPDTAVGDGFYLDNVLKLGDYGYGDRTPIEVAELRSYSRVLSEAEARSLYFEHIDTQGITPAALTAAMDAVEGHVTGSSKLSFKDLEAAVSDFVGAAILLPSDPKLLARAFDIVEAYEKNAGPLFEADELQTISALPADGESDSIHYARIMIAYHQAIIDFGLASEAVAGCGDTYSGRAWKTANVFPGAVKDGAKPGKHTVKIDARKPKAFGRPVAFSESQGRKPTGLYVPPGGVAEVTVPDELVNQGVMIVVGAHTFRHDQGGHDVRGYKRLPNVAARFDVVSKTTRVTNPLGGGLYIEIPYLADFGLVDITASGVVESPFLSLRSFDKMTADQWRERRTAPGPWADLVTDRFMVQVPRHWVYAWVNAIEEIEKWDTAMGGENEIFGFTDKDRNDVVLYMQADVLSRHVGIGGIGYPQSNTSYEPSDIRGGLPGGAGSTIVNFASNWTPLEIHELSHGQRTSRFPYETETMVNVPLVYINNVKFGMDLDEAFGHGFGGGDIGGYYTIDQAAIHWMVTENFRNGLEMAKDETSYQHRGGAKYSDMARLFGWESITGFYRAEQLSFENGTVTSPTLPNEVDERILNLSIAAGVDLTPLIHFWGVLPVDPVALKAAIADAGLASSPEIKAQLLRYRDLIPADNAAFNAYFNTVFPGAPPADEVPNRVDYNYTWFYDWLGVWDASYANLTRAALDAILAEYFP